MSSLLSAAVTLQCLWTNDAFVLHKLPSHVTWLVVIEVRSTSSGLVLHVQHIFANSFNFLISWGLPVTVFNSMCIHCVYSIALYRPTLFYACVYVSYVSWYVAPPGECYYNTINVANIFQFSSLSVVSCTFSALCVYSKFGHHPHPLGYLCAKI